VTYILDSIFLDEGGAAFEFHETFQREPLRRKPHLLRRPSLAKEGTVAQFTRYPQRLGSAIGSSLPSFAETQRQFFTHGRCQLIEGEHNRLTKEDVIDSQCPGRQWHR
jgi:hypothetical protein